MDFEKDGRSELGRLRYELRKRRKCYVKNNPKKRDEVTWTLHEKRLSDNECNARNDRWKWKERDNLIKTCTEVWKRWRERLRSANR